MDSTNLQDEREVDRVADHFVIVLAGLELLGQAATWVTYDYATMRERLTCAMVRAAAWPVSSLDDNGDPTDVVTLAALDALESIDDDNLEDPLRDWIIQCPRIIAMTSRLVGRKGWESTDKIELLLPSHRFAAESCLVIGTSKDDAILTVSQGRDIAARLVRCPATIEEAFKVAEDC